MFWDERVLPRGVTSCMFASSASERSCSSAAALLPLLGSAGLEVGACEERAERRGVPLTELRFERRCSGDDMVDGVVCRRLASSGMPRSEGCCFGLLVKVKQAIVRCGDSAKSTRSR